MRSTFFGLDIARKALFAQQRALDVTGHNIANAATPGYSRQRAVLTTTNPYTVPGSHNLRTAGQVGTGVQVSAIYRLRDNYIDYQLRSQSQHLGKASAEHQTLDRVEGIFLSWAIPVSRLLWLSFSTPGRTSVAMLPTNGAGHCASARCGCSRYVSPYRSPAQRRWPISITA